jgi:hypothetical protein
VRREYLFQIKSPRIDEGFFIAEQMITSWDKKSASVTSGSVLATFKTWDTPDQTHSLGH